MGNSRRNRQFVRIGLLASAILACAWLLPADVGMAASSTGSTKVTVNVADAIGVDFGKSALDSARNNRFGQVITEFVTQAASSRLAHELATDAAGGPGAIAGFGLPFGLPEAAGPGSAVLGGYINETNAPATEILVTVSNL